MFKKGKGWGILIDECKGKKGSLEGKWDERVTQEEGKKKEEIK